MLTFRVVLSLFSFTVDFSEIFKRREKAVFSTLQKIYEPLFPSKLVWLLLKKIRHAVDATGKSLTS